MDFDQRTERRKERRRCGKSRAWSIDPPAMCKNPILPLQFLTRAGFSTTLNVSNPSIFNPSGDFLALQTYSDCHEFFLCLPLSLHQRLTLRPTSTNRCYWAFALETPKLRVPLSRKIKVTHPLEGTRHNTRPNAADFPQIRRPDPIYYRPLSKSRSRW